VAGKIPVSNGKPAEEKRGAIPDLEWPGSKAAFEAWLDPA